MSARYSYVMLTRLLCSWETGLHWLNERGNYVTTYFAPLGLDRYFFDFQACTSAAGWEQFDTRQDASYFGVWTHLRTLSTLTYCEGDVSLVMCRDGASFLAELEDADEFYGDIEWGERPGLRTARRRWCPLALHIAGLLET